MNPVPRLRLMGRGALWLTIALPFVAPAWGQPTPTRIETYRTVGDVTLAMHVFEPAATADTTADPLPALVLFFGGGWTGGKPTQFYPQAAHLASRGIAVFLPEYRIRSVHGTDPFACVQDAKAAVRWVRQHATAWNLDPVRIGAGGGSAGGHLAAATAFLPGLDETPDVDPADAVPNCLVLFNPVVDNGPDGYGFERIKDRFPEFSPMHNISRAVPPPTLFMLGTEDRLIPVATAWAFADRIAAAGGRCTVHIYEGSEHGFFNARPWPNLRYYETLRATERFLADLGWVEGPPTTEIPSTALITKPAAPATDS